jgi:16S rRNA (cytosine1402-N4)-methyltransferase
MRDEAIAALKLRADGSYVDGTFGRGGHSRAILDALGPHGRLIAIDRDPSAIAHGELAFANEPRLTLIHATFDALDAIAQAHGPFDAILLDLGVSSPQLDEAERGFSFTRAGPLDMRMDTSQGVSAAQWLETVGERELADVLWRFGDEKFSRQIARAVVADRLETPFRTTDALAALVARIVKSREPGKHPATRTFQAIRIQINDELGQLERVLDAALDALKVGGRLVVLSFHSLEDRIVKQFLRRHSQPPPSSRRLPPVAATPLKLERPDAPQFPSNDEITRNPRARSVVLRAATRSAA